ncbi:MAG: hypothetical protein MI976_31525, partial [Pseudomonadales bacterium]|nr:hypothetical protein [Pseudomonadales bacterium]
MTANALQASQRLNEACLCHWSQCAGFAARASEAWQSDYPYFITRDDYILMAEFISLFSAITERHQYRSLIQQHLPEIVIQP